ncbi:hypothetical protein BJ508DRAFT_16226 [Ascobolus immersus RN42]|uniref:Uncharacterized protein n=1 Tax=Ascobolus immersus RN42 TaxID=1160509 RepID=A0A3N4HR28_ASCIM|nr:hypothetical protein BJ508DRAFT_16226 [Ascobolus immersus RN42]
MKREAKERARNQDHYAPYPDYQQRASLPPQQQQPQQQQQQQQQPQNPESTELRPVQNDPALLSAIETLASVARLSDTPNLNATELVKMIISDSQHLSLFSQLIRENQQKRVGNAAPNPPNSYPITYSNTTPTPSTPNNGFQTPLGQGGHYVDFNHPITANSSRSNSIQDTPSPTSSSFSDLMGTPTRIPLGSTPSTPVMMQNQQLVAPSTPAQPSYTPQSEAPTISTGTTPMPVPVPTVSAPQSVESSSPARAPRAPVAPVAPVAPIAPTANGNSQAPVRPSPGGQRAPMAPMAPVAPMAPTGPRVVPQEANKWSFASKEVNMLLPSALPMPAPLPQASQKELSPVASSSASPVVPATPSLAATAEVAPTALAAPPIPITNPTPDVPPTSAVPVAPTLPATNNSPERMTGSTLLSVSNEIQKTMGQPQAPIDLTGPEFDDDISPSNAGAKVAEVSLTTPTPDSTSQTSIVTAPETKQPEPRAESTQNEMPSANSMTLSDQPCNSNVPEPVQASPMSPTIKESAALVPSGAEASAPKQPVEGLQSGKSSEAEQPVQEREPFIPFGYGPTFDLSRESEEEQRALDEIIANFQGTHHDVEMSDSHPEPPQNTPEPSSNLTVPADMIDHFTQPHHLDTDMDDLDGWDLPELPEPHVLQAEAAARAQAAELEMAKQATASEHRDTAMLGSPSVLQAQEQLEQQAEDRSPPHLEAQKPVQTDAESNGQAASQPEKTSAAQTESQAREQPPSQTETQTQTQSEVPKAPDLGAYDETQKETPSLSQGEQPQRLSVDVLPSAQPEGLPDQGTKVHSALEFGQAAVQSVGKEVEAQHSTETVSQVSSQAVPALSGTQAAQAAMAPEASAQSTVGQSQVVSEQPRESSVVPGADAFAGLDLEGLVLDDETMALLEQAVQDESMMADLVEMLKNDVPAQPVQPTQVAQPTQPTQPTPPSGATISTAPEAASEPVLQNQEPVAAIPKAPSEETTTSNPHIDNGINHVDPFDMTAFNTGVNTPLNTGLNTPIGNQNIDFDEFERHLAELENTNMEGTNRTLDDATLDELLAELEGELKADNATNATVAPAAPESNPPQFSQQPETQTQLEVQLDFDPMEIDINQITEQLTDEELAALLQGDDLNFTLTAEDIANLKQTVNGIGQQEQQQQPQGILNGQTLDISTLEGAARELAMDEATHHALRQLLQALEQNPNLIDRCVNGQIDVSSLTGAGQKRAWDGHGDQGMAKRTNIAPIPNMSGLSAPRPMSSAVPPRPPYSTSSRSAKADENAEAYKASFGNSAAMNRRLMAPPAFRTPSITYGFSTSIPPKKKTDENKVKSMGFPPMLAGLKKPTPPTPQCT